MFYDYINDYVSIRKLKPENGGSDNMLCAHQTETVINHLSLYLFRHTCDIVTYVEQR